jgi:tRNA dimethylallyltransferase
LKFINQMETSKYLLVVVGPTAVGKTALCVKLAHVFHTDILSADSRQFFKELNVGTAKPDAEEMENVMHYFVNSHSIADDFSVGRFEEEAMQVLDRLFKEKDIVILTGGSGLYIKALCEGLDEFPNIDPDIRIELNKRLLNNGLQPLLDELLLLDPEYSKTVDKANSQRIIRALEVSKATGMAYSSFRKMKKKDRPFKIIKIGLTRDRKELYKRIDERMEAMLSKGLIQEATSLYPFKEKNALQTVGYQEIFDFMDGKYDWEETVRLLKRNSRRYAKRQMTWFGKDPEIKWFDPKEEDRIVEYVNSKILS